MFSAEACEKAHNFAAKLLPRWHRSADEPEDAEEDEGAHGADRAEDEVAREVVEVIVEAQSRAQNSQEVAFERERATGSSTARE